MSNRKQNPSTEEQVTVTLSLRQWLRIVGAAMNSDSIHTARNRDGVLTLGGDMELLDALNELTPQLDVAKEG